MIKKMVLGGLVVGLFLQGCAYGDVVDRVENALDDADDTLENLTAGDCIQQCVDVNEICIEVANEVCIDLCQVDRENCDVAYDNCVTAGRAGCDHLTDAAYDNCMDNVYQSCDDSVGDCDSDETDCTQACGSNANECLSTLGDCTAECVKELEGDFKDIDLNK